MAEANDTVAVFNQNLIDAGCDESTIVKCMQMAENGRIAGLIPLLSQHRKTLLAAVHSGQEQIDCLDYLICQIQKKRLPKFLKQNRGDVPC